MRDEAPDARLLEQWRLEWAGRLRSRSPEVLDAVATYVRGAVSVSGTRNAQLELGWREVMSACVECGLLAIEQGEEWIGPLPPAVVAQEHRAVDEGVELATSLACYLNAYWLAWDFVLDELARSKLSEGERMLVLRRISATTGSLLARLLAEVTNAHFDKLKHRASTSGWRNASLARRILAGKHVSEHELDYDLETEHVGLIAWGEGTRTAIAAIAERLGYQQWIVTNEDGTVWAWLGSRRACSAAEIERALSRDLHAGVFAAIGEPVSKASGFRETHGLAQAAYLVAQLSRQRITRYADVAREARALQDPMHSEWLIRTYVTPIVEHRSGAALRKTLEMFYEAAHKVDSASRLLGIDRHTINRRLDKVADIIGRPLPSCHSDIELALSLARLKERRYDGTAGSLLRQR
ncbi:MAG: helix-turn-helix domain-containing protein [Solirubrobacteraceae bacterium]